MSLYLCGYVLATAPTEGSSCRIDVVPLDDSPGELAPRIQLGGPIFRFAQCMRAPCTHSPNGCCWGRGGAADVMQIAHLAPLADPELGISDLRSAIQVC